MDNNVKLKHGSGDITVGKGVEGILYNQMNLVSDEWAILDYFSMNNYMILFLLVEQRVIP